MTRAEIAALVATRQDAMNRHDVAGLSRLFAADCRVESPTAGGVVKGRPAVDDINRAWMTGFPDVVFSTDDLLVEGETLAWIITASGTDTGGFMGLPPTGKEFALPMVILSTLRDGRIADERRIYDFTSMLVQVGILKAKASAAIAARIAAVGSPRVGPAPPVSRGVTTRSEVAELLARRHRAWEQRDIDALVDQHTDHCVMDSHLAGRVEGRAAIRQVYDAWFNAFPDSQLASERAIVDGNRIAEVATQSGTDTGSFLGLTPTGRPFRIPIVWLYTVEGGRFVYVRPIYDFTGMLVQLGVLKAKPA